MFYKPRTWQPWVFWMIAIIALFVSYAWFSNFQSVGLEHFQVHVVDSADYRFVAEHFWGIAHDYRTYAPEFSSDWGAYLSTVPFREIGIGTFYLAFTRVVGLNQNLIPLFLQMCFYAVYLLVFFCIWKRYNPFVALICLLVLLSPKLWASTGELFSEAFLRIIFLLMLSSLLWFYKEKDFVPKFIILFVLTLIASQIKSQWVLLSGIFFICSVAVAFRAKSIKYYVLSALFLLIPVFLILMHGIGWNAWTLTVGGGLHANVKTSGSYLDTYCSEYPDNTVCDPAFEKNTWWLVRTDKAVSISEWQHFDAQASKYFLRDKAQVMSDFIRGMYMATNFPAGIRGDVEFSRSPLFGAVDLFVWIVLLLGLFPRKTRYIVLFSLSLWLVPALGNVFAAYSARFIRPIAGIPLATGILVLSVFIQPYIKSRPKSF